MKFRIAEIVTQEKSHFPSRFVNVVNSINFCSTVARTTGGSAAEKRVGKIRSELNKGKKGSKTHVVASSQ